MHRIGKADEVFAYDEFGVSLSPESNDGFGFVGYLKDEISGTYFAQAREYLPEIGRFAGKDILKGKITVPMTLNEYSYCYNNPNRYVDLDGMRPDEPFLEDSNDLADEVNAISGEYLKPKTKIEKALDAATDSIWSTGRAAGMKFAVEEGFPIVNKNLQVWNLAKYLDDATPGAELYIDSMSPARTPVVSEIMQKYRNNIFVEAEDAAMGRATWIEKFSGSGASKAVSKYGVPIIGAAVDGYLGYREDSANGVSTSKKNSNIAVNVGSSLAISGVGAGAGAGLVALGVSVGPAGWIALGIGALVGWAYYYFFADKVKDAVNSLE